MKTTYTALCATLAFACLLTGCNFQQPEYVRMITAPELQSLMQRDDIFLVDVHTPEQPHIKGTDLFVPYDQIEQYQDRFPRDKNTPIYLYCRSGPMGNSAARSLHALGYRNLANLDGGANAWRAAGFAFQ
ncbi:rhodanese-like domain-containing protein [Methylolobus aquaticus]